MYSGGLGVVEVTYLGQASRKVVLGMERNGTEPPAITLDALPYPTTTLRAPTNYPSLTPSRSNVNLGESTCYYCLLYAVDTWMVN